MAASNSILNRLRKWIVKPRLVLTSNLFQNFKSHGILRLAFIPIWNEQNQPSFLKQSLLKHTNLLPIVQFSSKDTVIESTGSILKQKTENVSKDIAETILNQPLPKTVAKNLRKDLTRDLISKELSKDTSKKPGSDDLPKPKSSLPDLPKGPSGDSPKEPIESLPKEPTGELPKESTEELPQELPKKTPKETIQKIPKEILKEIAKEETPKETTDSPKEATSVENLSVKEKPVLKKGKVSKDSGDFPKFKDEEEDEAITGAYVPLMPFPEIIWPGLWKLCKNLFLIHFVIHIKIDPYFNPREFLEGAKEAVSQISRIVADGKIEELRGYVTDDAIEVIKPNLRKMTLYQRHHLEMRPEDIYVGFIDLVEVIIDKKTTPYTKFVEITCCFHSLRELMSFKKMYPEVTFYNIMEHKERISIGNYRFVRDYTEGSKNSGHWMINRINHFRPLDLPEFSS